MVELKRKSRIPKPTSFSSEAIKPCIGVLNPNEDDEMTITGYRKSTKRNIICWLCIIFTGGLVRIVLHWWSHWLLKATHKICPLEDAESVLVEENYQGKHKIFHVRKIKCLNEQYLRQEMDVYSKQNSNEFKQIDNNYDKNLYSTIHFGAGQFKDMYNARVFTCKQLRYAWDNQTQSFSKLKGLDDTISTDYYYTQRGLSSEEELTRRLAYGPNEINVPYKSIKTLLLLEILNPFYIFQIFSVVLWFVYSYYYYACFIIIMSVVGVSISVRQTKKNQDALRKTVENSDIAFVINNKGDIIEKSTKDLVIGDIVEIPATGCIMCCDAVLLSGNCIVDESLLTGESVPITKTPLPAKRDVTFNKKEHARHTVFCGTKVIQTRSIESKQVFAIVINTGNITAKGELIRSILYPPPLDYKFEKDSYKFIECLALIASVGFLYTLVSKILRGMDVVKLVVESLDVITIVVPPALPAAMTVGRIYAQKRLERNNIYCISPRSLNVAGSIDCCCFDKTGTLTEDGLDMWGVVPKSSTNEFQIPIKQIDRLPYDNFLFGMVTCHSITVINGNMMGDPLDLKMFESTGWTLEDSKDIPDMQKYNLMHPIVVRQPRKDFSINNKRICDADTPAEEHLTQRQSSVDDLLADAGLLDNDCQNDHGIVREFPFSSNLQRMSVITRRLGEKHFNVYCKGSPEMIQQLCKKSSIPESYSQQLAMYAKEGYRVIAISFKPLSSRVNYTKAQRLSRESVESDLEFLGFVVMENRLKPDTTDVIHSLTSANIRPIMVTGDNILTALSVAHDCGIVSPSQVVVTVNVRQLDSEQQSTVSKENNYELYYSIEFGRNKGNGTYLLNGRHNVYTSRLNSPENGIDEISSLSHESFSLPCTSSLTSIKTCETWTHNEAELEMGQYEPHPEPQSINWEKNYRFAMVGTTWEIVRNYFPDLLRFFLVRGCVYARMSPDQKQALIVELQNIDYSVAMCGDGANDCGALKVAHTGISLSETESAIASPFSSKNPTIACVPNIIKEGRAALATSFGVFKYMAAYSLVQFVTVMILYGIDSNLTDKEFLYIDLGLISIFAFFFGKTEAYQGPLVKQPPLNSLISLTPLCSICCHTVIVTIFQVAGWFHVHQQDWFKPFKLSDEDNLGCYENYTLFAISSFQYIILAFVFSKSKPYRRPIWSNLSFCLSLIINTCIILYLILYPAKWIANFFQIVLPPEMNFRYWMLIYGCASFIIHVLVEIFLIEQLILKKIQVPRENKVPTSKRKYVHIEYELQNLKYWPEITDYCEKPKSSFEKDVTPKYSSIKAEQSYDLPRGTAFTCFFEVAPMDSHETSSTNIKDGDMSPDSLPVSP